MQFFFKSINSKTNKRKKTHMNVKHTNNHTHITVLKNTQPHMFTSKADSDIHIELKIGIYLHIHTAHYRHI